MNSITTSLESLSEGTTGYLIDKESSDEGNSNRDAAIGASLGVIFIILIIGGIVAVILYLRLRRKQNATTNPENAIQMETKPPEKDQTNYASIKSLAQEIQDQRALPSPIPMLKDIEIKTKLGAGKGVSECS